MKPVRVRFAPSPTGLLHVGGVRTALFNYLYAKQQGGQFILRLEDTDRERFVAEGVEQIVAGLDWLGLAPDEGFWISQGQHQGVDYIQSERHKAGHYQKWADQLIEQGLAYYSKIPAAAYDQLKAADTTKPFVYRRAMEQEFANQTSKTSPIRLDIEAVITKSGQQQIGWRDQVRGEFKQDKALIEDFILIKSDGFPTYNFANVIDDHDMKISHVIRGDEFIASTAKHFLLYKCLGWSEPKFIHLPVINGQDGKKLSKRSGDTDVLDYQKKGYLPEALVNFLALLGWNPGAGETQEIFDQQALIKRFSLEHIQKSPAVFDLARLDWMNGEYIRALEPDQLLDRLLAFLHGSALAKLIARDRTYSLAAIKLVQDRLKRLDEAEELMDFFYLDPNPKQLDFGKIGRDEVREYIDTTITALKDNQTAFEDYGGDLEKLMRDRVVPQTGAAKPGPVFMAIRIALTGKTATPGLFETMEALGYDTVIRRLEAALKAL